MMTGAMRTVIRTDTFILETISSYFAEVSDMKALTTN